MKKVLFALVSLFMFSSAFAFAGDDKPIQVNRMPDNAQEFITTHFKNRKVALAKMDTEILDKSYEVIFTDGCKVEFDKKGQWTEVSCKKSVVPANIVPAAIRGYILRTYPDAKIIQIERDRKGYEVKLTNGVELDFDARLRLTDIDN